MQTLVIFASNTPPSCKTKSTGCETADKEEGGRHTTAPTLLRSSSLAETLTNGAWMNCTSSTVSRILTFQFQPSHC